jgi:cell division protein FtsA
VRIGKPLALRGLAEAHATPGFSTLAGLVLYAAADPVDIRTIGPSYQSLSRMTSANQIKRLFHALKTYF